MLGPLGGSVTPGSRSDELGVVAAGHPVSAAAGADALREGGNAVDAALAAMLASFAAEPLLTGLGAGGYMLVVAPGRAPTLLDFFVEAPGRESGPTPRADLLPVRISFGDAVQTFNIGVASVGCFGMPAGVCEASRRFGRLALETLVAPAARLAREGVELNVQQAYIVELLGGIVTSTPECAALFAPEGQLLHAGQRIYQPELADSLERLSTEGSRPFYEGDIGAAIAAWVGDRGGLLARADLKAYVVIDRSPLEVSYRGREVLINPPPSAGGLLIARALTLLGEAPGPPTVAEVVAVMERVQGERTSEFLDGLNDPELGARFLRGDPGPGAAEGRGTGPSRLGSTTHISVLDREGWACSVTCSNGSASGVLVPGTGIHLNNMLGEQDLNPHGFHRYPPGRRMPSMMAPTVVLRDGAPALAVGSAGSNRIRSAILQTIIRSIDEGATATEAVDAPRVHWEDGVVYTEPGVDSSALAVAGRELAPFRERNLFFGGVQAAARDPDGRFSGGGDPRRGGASVLVSSA
jgi:gamma-glutamyltranspeptidase/glutathione hydrolase